MSLRHCLFILTLIACSSCISNQETLYFQNPKYDTTSPQLFQNKNQAYRIRPGDVLSVKVKSLDPQYTDYLNKESERNFNGFNEAGLYVNGYSVADNGKIILPGGLGELAVAGKSLQQIRNEVQRMVNSTLKNATVFVALVSFKFSVLGDVNAPGYFYVYNDQLTILEALARAGDMTEFADRRHVHLIRQVNGGSQAIMVDLTDPEIMKSPYYYLQPNDALYVPNLEERNKRSNLSTVVVITTIFGGISAVVGLVTLVNNITNN